MRTRWQGKLREVKAQLKRRLHNPLPQVGAYLRSVVLGHVRYYGVPMNGPASAPSASRSASLSNFSELAETVLCIRVHATWHDEAIESSSTRSRPKRDKGL